MGKVNRKDQTFYIYRHVRLDTNEVFYVGKGTACMEGKSEKTFYKRAYDTDRGRNRQWLHIINQTDYIIEIIYQGNNENEILQKETEFINLYGRRDLNLGTLVNFDNGGRKPSGRIITDETRAKMRLRPHTKGVDHPLSKKIYIYDSTGKFYKSFDCHRDAARDLNVSFSHIGFALKSKRKRCLDMILRTEFEGENIDVSFIPKKTKSVILYDLSGNFLQEFLSITLAAKFTNGSETGVARACKNHTPYKGYLLSSKEPIY